MSHRDSLKDLAPVVFRIKLGEFQIPQAMALRQHMPFPSFNSALNQSAFDGRELFEIQCVGVVRVFFQRSFERL